MKMLKVHQNAPTSMLKSQNFSGDHTPGPPYQKGKGGRGGLGWVGKGGIGVWPTKKLSRGAPYGRIVDRFLKINVIFTIDLAKVRTGVSVQLKCLL
jgi:hypothetical protein